ncbi:unnamed protein product [Ceratitis capitata]|uniref:(Mediterranean fruit fly) hypothetical protein n=1 Tax=Ceratitis capitata TaxID=7213 RepID=A0A811UR09_CERCA|nr:unnamed protein product [Ceratitis capitata]
MPCLLAPELPSSNNLKLGTVEILKVYNKHTMTGQRSYQKQLVRLKDFYNSTARDSPQGRKILQLNTFGYYPNVPQADKSSIQQTITGHAQYHQSSGHQL